MKRIDQSYLLYHIMFWRKMYAIIILSLVKLQEIQNSNRYAIFECVWERWATSLMTLKPNLIRAIRRYWLAAWCLAKRATGTSGLGIGQCKCPIVGLATGIYLSPNGKFRGTCTYPPRLLTRTWTCLTLMYGFRTRKYPRRETPQSRANGSF